MFLAAATISPSAFARDIKIEIPRPSHLTPVQRLNRDGVEALRRHEYEKAEKIFYKAYLYDPDDPFTLNNLGYISELKGDAERAHDFYSLAAQHAGDAAIDRSTPENLRGKPMQAALAVPELPMQMNHDNVEAVRLLSYGRASEADLLLEQTLQPKARQRMRCDFMSRLQTPPPTRPWSSLPANNGAANASHNWPRKMPRF
jgi:tetratricopeptide (TPR) repeat protein